MTKYMIFSKELDQPIQWFQKYERKTILSSIIEHLNDNPNDCVELCKEPLKNDIKRFSGYIIVGMYEVNPNNNKPSLIINRNGKKYYKQIKN